VKGKGMLSIFHLEMKNRENDYVFFLILALQSRFHTSFRPLRDLFESMIAPPLVVESGPILDSKALSRDTKGSVEATKNEKRAPKYNSNVSFWHQTRDKKPETHVEFCILDIFFIFGVISIRIEMR
jgi:hypothetical protein